MKTAFITGASRGLGKGFVEYFLGQNTLVFAGVRETKDFDKKLASHPNLRIVKLDVSSDSSVDKSVKSVAKLANHLDYLINNAGINRRSASKGEDSVSLLPKLDRDAMLEIFNINSVAPMIILQKFLSLLTSNPSYVINISSNRASYHDENESTAANYGYRASKAALNMLTFCSLFDLPKNVRTFAVHPGSVKTDINPTGSMLPKKQAQKIIDITRNWKKEYNGKFLRFDGSFYPL